MSRFVNSATARVELGEGDWIEIRTRLTFGDRRAIEEILLGNRLSFEDVATLHHHAANMEVLRRSITAWGGPGFCELAGHPHDGECRARPLTLANLEQLDETGERLMTEIRKRQVTHSADLKDMPNTSTSTRSPQVSAALPLIATDDQRATDDDGTSGTSPNGSTSSSFASSTAGPGRS